MHARRRTVIVAGGAALAAPRALLAQSPAKVWRFGALLHGIRFERLRLRTLLQEVGLEEGRNLQWEVRSSDGRAERLDALAAELVAAKVDLIVAPGNPEAQAARRATQTIPIVMMFASSPVETGLVASLARPGGNVTGTSTNAPESAGKMVEVMRELLPRMRRIVWLREPDYPGMAMYGRFAEQAAVALGLKSEMLDVRSAVDLDDALRALERSPPDALAVATTGLLIAQYRRVRDFAAAHKLPTLWSASFPVSDGGLIAYSPNFVAMARRNAAQIDKIVKGTRPADIPVEEPAEFELVINLKTAKTLGLTVPQLLLMRAREVIE
jgi:putative tryptophan/tyrosine transport system substrate-binding protein